MDPHRVFVPSLLLVFAGAGCTSEVDPPPECTVDSECAGAEGAWVDMSAYVEGCNVARAMACCW